MNLDEALDDLSARFVHNAPAEALEGIERICFQVEEAHWFYLDFLRLQNPQLPNFSYKQFCEKFFAHCPILKSYENSIDDVVARFSRYKADVPVFGCAFLNPAADKVVLVRSMGASKSWGFPKGKINEGETDIVCAEREGYEETGYDARGKAVKEWKYTARFHSRVHTIYIVPNVPEDTKFAPLTRSEISEVRFHKISEIPSGNRAYFNVVPFMKWLKRMLSIVKSHPQQRQAVPLPLVEQSGSSASASTSAGKTGGVKVKAEGVKAVKGKGKEKGKGKKSGSEDQGTGTGEMEQQKQTKSTSTLNFNNFSFDTAPILMALHDTDGE